MRVALVEQVAVRKPISQGFRPDIQGLRAIAVGLVLLFHANAPFLTGGFVGVDVFFVISGFLITGILVREAKSTGRIRLGDFYAKRARRILPAATLVFAFTAVISIAILPSIRWPDIGKEMIAAAVYVVNWLFAGGTDYLNAEVAASPLQHFWTLAVEEQFYIVWPLLILVLLAVGRVRTRNGRTSYGVSRLLQVGVLIILLPSLCWSIWFTAQEPAPAYFLTTTRLWELAVGALVAVFATQLERIPDVWGLALGWAGLAGILASALLFTAATLFPGAAALLPTLATAAVIVGGMAGRSSRGAGALFSLRPMRWVGDISYSLYLWHWPLIVVATYLLGGELQFGQGLTVVLLSFVPAWLSYRYIEGPFRDWSVLKRSTRASLSAGGGLMALSVVLGVAMLLLPNLTARTAAPVTGLGAMALEGSPRAGEPVDVLPDGFTPTALDARSDNSEIYASGCHADLELTEDPGCVLGVPDAEFTVALVGDSHAASWAPTLEELAEKHGWKLRVFTKSVCAFADVTLSYRGGEPYRNCEAWNAAVEEILVSEKPDLLVTTNSANRYIWDGSQQLSFEDGEQLFAEGLHTSWSRMNNAGIPVAVIPDVPYMGIDVPECVSAYPEKLAQCSVSRAAALDDRTHPERLAISGLTDTQMIDMNDWICPGTQCPAIIGDVLIWRDGHHLTATYARSMSKPLFEDLRHAGLVPSAGSL